MNHPNMRPLVLIADPDPACQAHLIAQLQISFRCIATTSLQDTYQQILREPPALLVLEITQPDGNGLELVRQLQAHPVFQRILVACVTERASIKDKIAAFRVGVDDYLVKPLVPSMNFYGRMLLLLRAGHIARAVR
jgi:DNA-binding response OmpR family regulator